MSPQPVNQKGKESKRESYRQNKKNNERRCAGKNKMSYTIQNDKWERKQHIKKCERIP